MQESISTTAMLCVLDYIYSGHLKESNDVLLEIVNLANHFDLEELVTMATNILNEEAYLNIGLEELFFLKRNKRARSLLLNKRLLEGARSLLEKLLTGVVAL